MSNRGVLSIHWGFTAGSDRKESACSARDTGLIPGSGRFPGKRNGYPHQYSCLENSRDGETWGVTVHGIAKELDKTEQLTKELGVTEQLTLSLSSLHWLEVVRL